MEKSKKKFKDTRVGKFLSKAAPNILNAASDIVPDAGILKLVGGLISKDEVLTPKDKEENGSSCGTRIGWTRAGQLARKENISRDTIARMASFKRHQQHKDVPYEDGCGGIMWDAWGGASGVEWAINKLKQIDKK